LPIIPPFAATTPRLLAPAKGNIRLAHGDCLRTDFRRPIRCLQIECAQEQRYLLFFSPAQTCRGDGPKEIRKVLMTFRSTFASFRYVCFQRT
jgi:hypothetical protein